MGESKAKSDRERIIGWYEDDIKRYKGMIGEVTEYKTVVTQKLIDNIQKRVDELKAKGIKNDTARRCVNQD